MKKIIWIFLLSFNGFADTYWAEIGIDDKAIKSSYILKDGEKQESLSAERIRIEITKDEYEKRIIPSFKIDPVISAESVKIIEEQKIQNKLREIAIAEIAKEEPIK